MVTDEGRFRVQAPAAIASTASTRPATSPSFSGQAIYEARNSALPVTPASTRSSGSTPAACRSTRWSQPARDAFAGWNDDRDRAEDRVVAGDALRLARDDRRRGPRPLRPVAADARVRRALGAALGRAGWAPYTHRPLGLGAPVGLDLGRRRAVGLRAVPLRPLGLSPQRLVLGARHLRRAPGVRAGAGGVGRRPAHRRLDLDRRRPRRSAGSRSRRARSTCRPTAPARATCSRSTSPTSPTSPTSRRSSTTATARPTGATSPTASTPHAVTFVPAEVMTQREPVAPAAARFRNDPQVRALVANNAQPAPVLTAPPVTAPPAAPRPPQGRPAPRPPFEGRAPGAVSPGGRTARVLTRRAGPTRLARMARGPTGRAAARRSDSARRRADRMRRESLHRKAARRRQRCPPTRSPR